MDFAAESDSEQLKGMEQLLSDFKQEHLFEHAKNSSIIFDQIQKMDIRKVMQNFEAANAPASKDAKGDVAPLTKVYNFNDPNCEEDIVSISEIGWKEINDGKVCAVIMSGGQGTRLGFSGPKGMYDFGLPSRKCIFQLHVEKISRLKILCAKKFESESGIPPNIPIYIMTSHINHQSIIDFFKSANYFNYPSEDIIFFEQSLEPTFTFDGKIIVDNQNSLSLAPGGNGGIYKALHVSGAVDDMTRRGILHLHVFS